jgi:hypothetical protein
MNKKNILAGLALVAGLAVPSLAFAANEGLEPKHPAQGYPHERIIGAHYDRAAAQRGFHI